MSDSVKGVIDRVTHQDADSGYCVLRVMARGHRDPVTVVGRATPLVAGEFVEADGEWVTDRTYGPQFKADAIRGTPPHTVSGIAKYLGSGLVKGIGAKYAQKIVDAFGDKTLEVIDQSPTYLSQVKGLGPKRIELIRRGWQEQKHVRAIMVFLQSYGIGTARAFKIYKLYGDSAIDQVRANPYKLSTDLWGVGFKTADELAQKLGVAADSPLRAAAAVRHVLKEGSGKGHVALPEPLALEEARKLTGINDEVLTAAIDDLRQCDEVVRDHPFLAGGRHARPEPIGEPGFDDYDSLLYLKPLFNAEVGVARTLQKLMRGPHPLPATDSEAALDWVEKQMGLAFAPAQRAAVKASLTEKILVLTGGPGTGKTTIVRAIIELFEAKKQRVGLCAPTGRAAKRLAESTGREARTVHRLLEYDAALGGFRRNAENPLEVDLLVIDEASMADVSLANRLLNAVPPWAAVVVVGDGDQLPSVGPGCVLADLIGSGVIPVARLTQVHRQAGASWIVRAAHAINAGEEPESAPAGGQGDFYFVETDDDAAVIERIVEMVRTRIPARFGLDAVTDVQVLSPMNKSPLGVKNLNHVLQEALNPLPAGAKDVQRFGISYRVGDKVIQTQNNYQREVYNGDIGRIASIDSTDQIVSVLFDGKAVDYDFGDLDELQLAYCCSIHKSQGSEYPAVVIPVHTQHWIMLQRNLIYTGVTRGKKLVALVGSRKALGIAVRKADQSRRFSLLRWRLRNGAEAAAPIEPGA